MNNKGAVLMMVLMVLTTLGVLGTSVTLRSVNESRLAQRDLYSTQAFWIAEAGIQKTIWEINKNSCQGMINQGSGIACTSCGSCGAGPRMVSATLGAGAFSADVDAALLAVGSRGYYPSMANPQLRRNVYVDIGSASVFGFAAFAAGQMTLDNNVITDSYNSNNGNYGGANVGDLGNVGTNGTSLGIINMSNNVTVNGMASTGPGGTVAKSNHAIPTEGESHANNVTLSPVTIPSSLSSSTFLGALSFSNNQTRTLTGGNYKYDYISMSNNAVLNITADSNIYLTNANAVRASNNAQIVIKNGAKVRIYTDGVIDVSNNVTINNQSKTPSKFIIYSTYTGATGIKLGNNGSLYGAVYAPQTKVDYSNNTVMYGALVGKTVTMSNNVTLHYDEALGSLSDPNAPAKPKNWQEI